MTTMAFVYLARNAGPTFGDLALEIRALTRPGDRVVVVDDGSTDDTPARIGRFGAFEGWGPGVTLRTIITGARVTADLGLALNLALQDLAIPLTTPGASAAPPLARVVVMTAGSRIDTGLLAAARTRAETEDLDLLVFPLRQWSLAQGGVIDPPGHDAWAPGPGSTARAHALRQVPALGRMIIGWPLLQGPPALRAAEARDSHSDLALVWHLLGRARRIGVTTDPAGHGPQPPAPGWSTVQAAAELIRSDPAAAPWVLGHLPALFAGLTAEGAARIATRLTSEAPPPALPSALISPVLEIIKTRTD